MFALLLLARIKIFQLRIGEICRQPAVCYPACYLLVCKVSAGTREPRGVFTRSPGRPDIRVYKGEREKINTSVGVLLLLSVILVAGVPDRVGGGDGEQLRVALPDKVQMTDWVERRTAPVHTGCRAGAALTRSSETPAPRSSDGAGRWQTSLRPEGRK